ncbi:hypothetical protein HT031_002731 [Scenedesmus sp. PABB004]|nr:hypothetical protein HT031_002731 [Scenedesmus sp. PABB004]
MDSPVLAPGDPTDAFLAQLWEPSQETASPRGSMELDLLAPLEEAPLAIQPPCGVRGGPGGVSLVAHALRGAHAAEASALEAAGPVAEAVQRLGVMGVPLAAPPAAPAPPAATTAPARVAARKTAAKKAAAAPPPAPVKAEPAYDTDTDDMGAVSGGGGSGAGGKGAPKRRRRIRNAKQQELNRLAQQRYRERKKQKYSSLQGTVEELSTRLGQLNTLEAANGELAQRNGQLQGVVAEQQARLAAQQQTIGQQAAQLESQAAQLSRQAAQLQSQGLRIEQQEGTIAELRGRLAAAGGEGELNEQLSLAVRAVLAGVGSMASLPPLSSSKDAAVVSAMFTSLPEPVLAQLRSCCREVALHLKKTEVKETPHAIQARARAAVIARPRQCGRGMTASPRAAPAAAAPRCASLRGRCAARGAVACRVRCRRAHCLLRGRACV